MTLTRLVPGFVLTIVAGAAAGDVAVPGIKVGDYLGSVLDIAGVDLTSEFTITDTDTINNTGGTASAGSFLLVGYVASDARGGSLTRA